MKKILIALIALISSTVYSQNINDVNDNSNFKDACFSDRIKSVQLVKTGDNFADVVIALNSAETVTLTFDEVHDYNNPDGDYYYTIEHCDADWKKDNLITSEYMTGFQEIRLDEIEYSQGTNVSYRNFKLTLPNTEKKLKVSGNYLIKVFERDNKNPVILKGFSIVEPLTGTNVGFMPPLNRTCMQQLDIKVSLQSLKVLDPRVNLKVRVERNFARIPQTQNPAPAFIQPGLINYTLPEKNTFQGVNEFRTFDIRSLGYSGQGVASIKMTDHVELTHDTEKTSYIASNDVNGKFLIGSDRYTNVDTQAEYAKVSFSLSPKSDFEGRIFLFGELTNWSISEKYEMLHNETSYSCTVLLKQGYYNYTYVTVDSNGNIDMAAIDGCFYDTENLYSVYVYHKAPSDKYDRLVGFKTVKTR